MSRSNPRKHREAISWLLARTSDANARSTFVERFEQDSVHTCLMPSQTTYWNGSEDIRIFQSSSGQLHGLVIGKVDQLDPEKPEELADHFEQIGYTYAAQLSGSYTVILHDKKLDRVVVLSDYIGSQKIYWGKIGDHILLTTHLDTMSFRGLSVDPVGLGWFITNNLINRDRTIFEQFKVLSRNSALIFDTTGVRIEDLDPHESIPRLEGMSVEDISKQFETLMLGAIERMVSDKPHIVLPLTGGCDSQFILAALVETFGHRDISTYTYIRGEVVEGSDAFVAASSAKRLGVPHTVLQSCTTNLGHSLVRNAEIGQCGRDYVHEVDAWDRIALASHEHTNAKVVIGDNMFGWPDRPVSSVDEILKTLSINDATILEPYNKTFKEPTMNVVREGLQDDIRQIVESVDTEPDMSQRLELIVLKYRFPRLLATLGQYYAGQFAPVCRPLIDKELTKFVMQIPFEHRANKMMYRRIIKRLYPEVFKPRLADFGGFELNLLNLIRENKKKLRDTIDATAGPADMWVSTAQCQELLSDICRVSPMNVVRSIARQILPSQTRAKIQTKVSPNVPKPLHPEVLLIRLLLMRTFLSQRLDDVDQIWTPRGSQKGSD